MGLMNLKGMNNIRIARKSVTLNVHYQSSPIITGYKI